MAVSNVAIANRALQKLGTSNRISSLTQDSANARTMNTAFEIVRNAELRRYLWSFAIGRASIAEDAAGPTWGDWNRYSLPNDFVRLIRDDETGFDVDWKVEGRYILSRTTSPLEIKYVQQITDPTQFDALFVEVFASRLAMETVKEVTDSTTDLVTLTERYKDEVAEAKKVGAIEKGAQEFNEDTWTTARY